MILRDKKIIFLHIPKCAGKSVEIFFTGKTVPNPHNHDWKLRESIVSGSYKKFYKFVIVRDPIDRVLSVYNHYKNGGMGGASDTKISNVLKGVGINNFVRNIDNYCGKLISLHMLGLQYRWVFDGRKKMVDDVLLFDDLPENVINIGKNYGINVKFPHINKSKKFVLREDLSNKSLNKLFERYEWDFKLITSLNVEKKQ